jgi:hypothetical protein
MSRSFARSPAKEIAAKFHEPGFGCSWPRPPGAYLLVAGPARSRENPAKPRLSSARRVRIALNLAICFDEQVAQPIGSRKEESPLMTRPRQQESKFTTQRRNLQLANCFTPHIKRPRKVVKFFRTENSCTFSQSAWLFRKGRGCACISSF